MDYQPHQDQAFLKEAVEDKLRDRLRTQLKVVADQVVEDMVEKLANDLEPVISRYMEPEYLRSVINVNLVDRRPNGPLR